VNIIRKLKSLPRQKNFLSIAIVTFLIITLPLFIWALVTQRFNIGKRASTGEPGVCVSVNKVIRVTQEGTDGFCHNLQTAVNAVDGADFTIEIDPGFYQIYETVRITGKTNLTIKGSRPDLGPNAVNLNTRPSEGWAILIENSSGAFEWLSMTGGSNNGMLSIHNSHDFRVGYVNLYSDSSHTMDIQGSRNISVYNSEIQSSAGGLEVFNSQNIDISNNRLHNNASALSIDTVENVNIFGNLIADNRDHGIWLNNINGVNMIHNSILNNSTNPAFTYPVVEFSGTLTGNNYLTQNIIAHNLGIGVKVNLQTDSITFNRNDVWNVGGNYSGVADPTGVNGNISEDPRVNSAPGSNYCLFTGSPAIFGDVSNGEYMGYIGPCLVSVTPSPTFTPRPPAGECQMCGGFAGIMCQTGFVCQMEEPGVPDQSGVCVRQTGGSSCYGTPSPSPSGSPSPTPTAPPNQTLSFLVKFAGVTDESATGATVKVYIQTPENLVETPPVDTHYEGNGIYRATFSTWNRLADGRYPLYIKGEKHIRARFCNVNSKLTRCGGAAPSTDGILIDADGGTYDLTAYSLEPGDLFEQDGVADYRDFRKIITLMGKSTASLTERDLLTADLNYDGVINIRDAFMMRQSLSSRQDD
jgi:hypothetical protein